MKFNENIALAKSILRKNSIAEDDLDYLKIREIVGKSFGYVGILTKLRYIDGVKDFDELTSIYDVIKDSKIDIAKLTKMSYDDILDIFYDELNTSSKTKNKDYELIYKDDIFSYFRVYTYEGILQIGSPAWCLKTKSNWNNYQAKYPDQWVVIYNENVKSIMTPNNFYLSDKYVNRKKPWVRYGLSFNEDEYVAHDDNDERQVDRHSNYTFIGIYITITNLRKGIKKSYYQHFPGTELFKEGKTNSYFRITSDVSRKFLKLTQSTSNHFNKNDKDIMIMNRGYSSYPVVLSIKKDSYPIVRHTGGTEKKAQEISTGGVLYNILKNELDMSMNKAYLGLRIKFGFIKEYLRDDEYIFRTGKWVVFRWNNLFHIVVNVKIDTIYLPTSPESGGEYYGLDEPCFYFIDINKNKNNEISLDTEESREIIEFLKKKKEKENPTKINKFRNFLGL